MNNELRNYKKVRDMRKDLKPASDITVGVHVADVARFYKIYDNLPLEERKQVVLVLGKEPISWEVARNEIVNKTDRGEIILQKLIQLEII